MKKMYFVLLASLIIMPTYGQSSELVFLKLNMNNGSGSFYNTDIYFNDNATLGFDFGYDAQFFGAVPAFSIYSLLVEENVGEPYVLQAVNTDDLADVTLSIGVNATSGQELTFRIATSTLPPTTQVYLDDTETGISTFLNTSDYIITPTTNLSGTGRFFLRIFDETLISTYTFDGSWSPSDPSGITTIDNDLVILSGDAALTTDTTVNTISIEPGASLTIASGELSATNINLMSTSNSYSSLIQESTSNIAANEIIYERYINSNSGGNDLVAAPLMGQTWQDFLGDNTSTLLNDGNNNPTAYAFAPFDKSTGDFENLNSNSDYLLSNGVGYRAATTLGETVTFTGVYPSSDVTVDITNEGPDYAEWNLVGNPYPSYINVFDFFNYELDGGVKNIDLLTAVRAGVYAYNGNGYDIINLANVAAKPLMAPGQGFFVSANENFVSEFDLEFSIAMQTTGNNDDYIAGRNETLIYMTLEMDAENNQSKTDFYFNDDASLGLDIGYDAAIWGETIPDFSIYSHLLEDNTGIPIGLQTMNSTQLTNVSIPLGVHAIQGEQLTFSITESALPDSVNVYLDDVVANTSTLLNNSNYIITPTTTLSGTGRFFLRTSESALSSNENSFNTLNIFTSNNSKELVISGNLQGNTSLELYDIQGKIVLSKKLDSTLLENRIDTSVLSAGVYVVTINDDVKQKSQKVIIK